MRDTKCSLRRRETIPWPMRAAAFALVLSVNVLGCASTARLPAVPLAMTTQAQPIVANARYWPDRDTDALVRAAQASIEREQAWLVRTGQADAPLPPLAFLAVSGGGDNGAFGAGLLVGWTERGDRPTFRTVTGVSTGALIAPFAFLGPQYDETLREAYTEVSRDHIFRPRMITAALFNDAMADTRPLARLIEHHVTREVLDEIAEEYAKGRLLFVGTTDLDSRQPVIWDMTAIAASSDPGALALFRQVILASASIPAAFPPVMIDVSIDGRRYQEMHVDGGASHQVFMYPPSFRLTDLGPLRDRQRSVYVIRNARLDADWASVDRRTLSIAGRSVGALIHSQGLGDLTHIFMLAQRDNVDFNLAYIPADFDVPRVTDFDTHYMRALFERGREIALVGNAWHKLPPAYPAFSRDAPREREEH